MRVKHWLKNGLIFMPIIFDGRLFDLPILKNALLGFLAFSLISSFVYVVNDIRDVEKDRLHPIKKNRPIAAGTVSIGRAYLLAGTLFVLSFSINAMASLQIQTALWMFLYAGLNLLYSFGLKDIPLVDVSILVSGFLLRLIYGGAVTGIGISHWLYLTVISMSFYLGLGKRRNEIKKQGDNARNVLKYYTHDFLDKSMYMCLSLTIMFYAMWAVNPANLVVRNGGNLVWSVPLVMLICMKYSMKIEGDSFGDPVDVVLADKMLIALVLLYMVSMFVVLYGSLTGALL